MTNQDLHEHFIYEPETGMLRKIKGGRKPYPWRAIGTNGAYLATTFQGETLYLHRLVWQCHKGEIVPRIDHRDGDTRNCRIDNLRPATSAQNQYNSRRKKNNRSGAKGVVYHRKCLVKPWQAKIVVDGRVRSLGYYPTLEEAAAAYDRGARQFAGEFARLNNTEENTL